MGRSLRGARRAARDRSGRGGGRVVLQTALVQAGLHGTTYVMGTTLAGRYLSWSLPKRAGVGFTW
jgi:hypothetical protein